MRYINFYNRDHYRMETLTGFFNILELSLQNVFVLCLKNHLFSFRIMVISRHGCDLRGREGGRHAVNLPLKMFFVLDLLDNILGHFHCCFYYLLRSVTGFQGGQSKQVASSCY